LYIGKAAVGLVKNLSISDVSGNTQIFEVGSPVATVITSGKYVVNVSGSIVLTGNNNLFSGNFLPKTPYELMAQAMSGMVFDIEVGIFGIQSGGGKEITTPAENTEGTYSGFGSSFADDGSFEHLPAGSPTDYFIRVKNCRCNKITTDINLAAPIECKFEAIGQVLEKQAATKISGFHYSTFSQWQNEFQNAPTTTT
jgi:hypothetical protein